MYSIAAGNSPGSLLVIAAGGGRDLAWPHQRVAAELLARSSGQLVHLLLHGGARGADAAIGRAAHQLGWSSVVMPARWARPWPGGRADPQSGAARAGHCPGRGPHLPGFDRLGAGGGVPRWRWHRLAGAAGPPHGLPFAGADLCGGGQHAAGLWAVPAGIPRS